MKKIIAILFGLVLLFSLSSCNEKLVKLEGERITSYYDANGDYDELVVENIRLRRGTNDTGPGVFIKSSDTKAIEVKMQESFKNELKVNYSGKKIIISADRYSKYQTDYDVEINITGLVFRNINISGATICDVDSKIDTAENARFVASGASIFTFKTIVANDVEIKLSGASQFRSSFVTGNSIKVAASGASNCNISGDVKTAIIELSGASQFRSFGFFTDDARVGLSGASSIEITANKTISGSASGASIVNYDGEATVNVDVSGASVARHR